MGLSDCTRTHIRTCTSLMERTKNGVPSGAFSLRSQGRRASRVRSGCLFRPPVETFRYILDHFGRKVDAAYYIHSLRGLFLVTWGVIWFIGW